MAEGDNQARFTDTGTRDEELAGGTAKSNPNTKNRLPEDSSRVSYYVGANQKDILPEHQARRDAYPFINAR